jgi:hypothetical protein
MRLVKKQIPVMAPEIYRWWWSDRSRGDKERGRGDESSAIPRRWLAMFFGGFHVFPNRPIARKNSISKRVSNGYTGEMTKDTGLRIRVERELRDEFLEVCRVGHVPAAQVLRTFMREYVAARQPLAIRSPETKDSATGPSGSHPKNARRTRASLAEKSPNEHRTN